jgi:hypothetical protein
MPQISILALTLFLLLVATLALGFILAVNRAAARSEAPTLSQRWTWRAFVLVVIWLAVPAALAKWGVLQNFASTPPPLMLLVAVLTLTTLGLAFSPFGSRLVSGIGIGWLVGFQAFRLPLEWLLHRLYQEGVVPVQMTYAGRNFDFITGAVALVILLWGAFTRPPSWVVWLFNLTGLALLINIVTIAILSLPVSFRHFTNEPANTFVAYFPYVWLPTFLVQAAWFGHLLVFRWLRQHRQTQ